MLDFYAEATAMFETLDMDDTGNKISYFIF